MGLQQEIDAEQDKIRADGYSMTVGEFISLYEHNELDMHPECQRFFRWDIWQKSRLIESTLLGIPLPSVSVSRREDGVWDVLDGLQQLSTIFEFVGILKDEKKMLVPPLKLAKTKYLPSLEGIFWDDESFESQQILSQQASPIEDKDSQPKILTSEQRFLIRRAKIHMNVILRDGDKNSKYELFERLNIGKSHLSEQELRNCTVISLNPELYKWMSELSRDAHFLNCVNLTDKAIIEQYDMELVLRFLVFRKLDVKELEHLGNLDEFLTDKTIVMATSKDFDQEKESRYFRETFELLDRATGGDSFRKYDTLKGRFTGGFLASAFEAIALGLGYVLDFVNIAQLDIETQIKQIWQMQEFIESASSGFHTPARIQRTIPLGRKVFKP